jgi:hypothetical protein
VKLILWIIIAIGLTALVLKLFSGSDNAVVEREQYRASSELAECTAPVPPQAADGTSTEVTEAGFEENAAFTENSVAWIWIIIPDDEIAEHTAAAQSGFIYRRAPDEDARRILRILVAYDGKFKTAENIAASTP